MNRLQHPGNESLDALIKHAMGYAEFSMKNIGRVSPTFLVQTSDGILVYIPDKMGDERSKDNFANTARMIAVAYGATAVVMILESWITRAKGGKPVDPSILPSESPDREECVTIMGECVGVTRSKILLIERNAKGVFAGFGSWDLPELDEIEGRFAGIMPPKPPTEENRKMARQVLLMMGVMPENRGFNPMWN